MINALTRALGENAVLAGLDLTSMVGSLGRLPTDAEDQKPALALLRKLCAMLIANEPIDLIVSEESQLALVRVTQEHGLSLREHRVGKGDAARPTSFGGIDNGNPARLTAELVDTAGACLLAMAELHLPGLRATIGSGWRRWRSELQIAPPPVGPEPADPF